MIHRVFLPAALALAMCFAALPLQAQPRGSSATVRVSMEGGQIQVSTENVVLAAGAATITWIIDSAGWRFRDGSIDFGPAAGGFGCRVFNDGAAISCNRNSSAPRGEIPYRIRVSEGGPLVSPPQPYVYISLD